MQIVKGNLEQNLRRCLWISVGGDCRLKCRQWECIRLWYTAALSRSASELRATDLGAHVVLSHKNNILLPKPACTSCTHKKKTYHQHMLLPWLSWHMRQRAVGLHSGVSELCEMSPLWLQRGGSAPAPEHRSGVLGQNKESQTIQQITSIWEDADSTSGQGPHLHLNLFMQPGLEPLSVSGHDDRALVWSSMRKLFAFHGAQ